MIWNNVSAAAAANDSNVCRAAAQHGVSEALYLRDPDGNGIELYWDRPRAGWPVNPDGSYAMVVEPLDLEALLAEASAA